MAQEFSDGVVDISFPFKWPSGPFGERLMPEEILEWLSDKDPRWGIINGKRVGVYLRGDDALAFRLRFGL